MLLQLVWWKVMAKPQLKNGANIVLGLDGSPFACSPRCLRTQDWEEDKDYNFESEHHILWDAAVAT